MIPTKKIRFGINKYPAVSMSKFFINVQKIKYMYQLNDVHVTEMNVYVVHGSCTNVHEIIKIMYIVWIIKIIPSPSSFIMLFGDRV